MHQYNPPGSLFSDITPSWADDFPDYWKDQRLLKQADGDPVYLSLLAYHAMALLRAELSPNDPDAADYLLHKTAELRAYEHQWQLTSLNMRS